MPVLIDDCPRCGAKSTTFDILSTLTIGIEYGWQKWFEAFSVCRHCQKSTVFLLVAKPDPSSEFFKRHEPLEIQGSISGYLDIDGFVSTKDRAGYEPPDHVPEIIAKVFREGAFSIATGSWNAAGAMFRLCIDLATKPMLPPDGTPGIKRRQRRDLGLRLPWLFEHGLIPKGLEPLSTCIREDGNDAVHAGTLTAEDAHDLLDFTTVLLERLFTEPKRLEIAGERREARRKPPS